MATQRTAVYSTGYMQCVMLEVIHSCFIRSEEECAKAYALFNARWYASKQLSCEFSPVTKWKSAICGTCTNVSS